MILYLHVQDQGSIHAGAGKLCATSEDRLGLERARPNDSGQRLYVLDFRTRDSALSNKASPSVGELRPLNAKITSAFRTIISHLYHTHVTSSGSMWRRATLGIKARLGLYQTKLPMGRSNWRVLATWASPKGEVQ